MFYEPGSDHGLPRDPFKSCVVPRPIGWISTVSLIGQHNLAPYSQFNNLTFDPPYVMFSANQKPDATRKDTTINVEATGIFCWNMATYDLRHAVNASAEQVPHGEDEFSRAGVTKELARLVSPCAMVAESPIRFECRYHSTLRLPGNPPMGTVDVVIGRVVGVHIKESVMTAGKVDLAKARPIARCGYYEYAVVGETFEMVIPGGDAGGSTLLGLEGSVKGNREEEAARRRRGAGDAGYTVSSTNVEEPSTQI